MNQDEKQYATIDGQLFEFFLIKSTNPRSRITSIACATLVSHVEKSLQSLIKQYGTSENAE